MIEKDEIRSLIREKRSGLSPEKEELCNSKIFSLVQTVREYQTAGVIYTYVDIRHEVSTRDIILASLKAGRKVAVPKIEDQAMRFYQIESLTDLRPGYFGIEEPLERVIPPPPDLILVPGVAFSYKMERIGYGKGFYDRYLTENVRKIGLAFDFQMFDELPVSEYDVLMDAVVTEKGVFS